MSWKLKGYGFFSLIIFIVLASAAKAAPPDTSKPTIRLHPMVNAGIVFGQNGRDLHVEVIESLVYKGWSAGLGAGLNYYQFRSVPLFVSGQKLFQKSIPFFVYGNLGVNLPWVKKDDASAWFITTNREGVYYDVGAGWKFDRKSYKGLSVSVGFSEKTMQQEQKPPFSGPGITTYVTRTAFQFRSFLLKIGYRF